MNLLQRLCDRIRRSARVAEGRDPSSSAAVIDTQSARAERQGGPGRGRDPNKKVTGRKRHVMVLAEGLLLAVVVHPANEDDGQSAPPVLEQLLGQSRAPESDLCRQRVQGTTPFKVSGKLTGSICFQPSRRGRKRSPAVVSPVPSGRKTCVSGGDRRGSSLEPGAKRTFQAKVRPKPVTP